MNADLGAAVAAMIADRSSARAATFEARQQARRQFRAVKKTRRDAGLIARHAQKLGRSRTAN